MKTPNPELIDEIVKRITKTIQPLRIILFGSAARGEMRSGSDIDLLIIVPDGTSRRETARKVFRALSGLGIAKDIIVGTESDIKKFGQNPSLIIKPALDEGVEVYHAA